MKKGVLIILDGYGEGKAGEFNAVRNAKSPFLHSLKEKPISLLKTCGEAVGLLEGEMGGSEVGHMTIGAGRIVPSTAKRIYDDIASQEFKKNKNLTSALNSLKARNGDLHLVGLMSDKGVHSDINHAYEIIDLAKNKAKNIFLHLITDGRDCGDFESLKYLKDVREKIKAVKNCEIASVSGRSYTMDRDGNLGRTDLAFNALFTQTGELEDGEIENYLSAQHRSGKTDQYIYPIHIKTKHASTPGKNDTIMFFNFREDRLRQIVKRTAKLKCDIITMIQIGEENTVTLYEKSKVKGTLSEYLSELGLKQIKISETTKYAHVTYYLNGGTETPFAGEDRVHIPTLQVENFNKTPKMRAKEITEETLKAVDGGYDAIILNFSNPDMIGHTGDYDATVKAIEFLDKCVEKIVKYARKKGYFLIVTADHGNSEEMRRPDGTPHSAHTLNRVFCAVVDDEEHKMKKYGGLKDVAPTFLDLMGVEQNPLFEGKSLINHKI